MEIPQLTLTIKEDAEQIGGVPLEALTTIVEHFRKLVDEVSNVVGEHYGVRTGTQLIVTNMTHGSAVFELAAIPRRVHVRDISGPVVNAVAVGLLTLEEGPERPFFFSDRALNEATKLVRPLKQQIRSIVVAAQAQEEPSSALLHIRGFPISGKLQTNVRKILSPRHVYLGSVEGRIYKLEKRVQRLECTLYDRVRRQAITCWVPSELENDAHEAFNQRVLVGGRLFADEYGKVQRVEMQQLRRMHGTEEQPPLNSLLGSAPHFTNGVDAVKYVRAMRDEQTTAD